MTEPQILPPPPFSFSVAVSDVGNKQRVTEFVCLAIETSSGRQLGRFARFVRVVPAPASAPTPAPPQPSPAAVATMPPQLLVPSNLPPQQLPQQPQLLQPTPPPQQLAPGDVHPAGVVVPAGGAAAAAAAASPAAAPVVTGVANPESSALPLPDVLQDLQQWMASVGLNPGPPDAGGFSERGNFRFDSLDRPSTPAGQCNMSVDEATKLDEQVVRQGYESQVCRSFRGW